MTIIVRTEIYFNGFSLLTLSHYHEAIKILKSMFLAPDCIFMCQ